MKKSNKKNKENDINLNKKTDFKQQKDKNMMKINITNIHLNLNYFIILLPIYDLGNALSYALNYLIN